MLRPHQKAFLAAFRQLGNITLAAEAAKVGRRSHYDWMDEAPYAEAFEDATEEATDRLVGEARRRAVEGVDKPVFYQGVECGAVREYSDTLLMFLIKAERPDKYRENVKVEHSGEIAIITDRLQAGRARLLQMPKREEKAS